MHLPKEIGEAAINVTIEKHPRIGEILQKYVV